MKKCTFAVDHWYLKIKSFRARSAVQPKIITSLSVGKKSAQFINSFLTLRELSKYGVISGPYFDTSRTV